MLNWLKEPATRGMDIDDPSTTALRRDIIRQKKPLFHIYEEWYRGILDALPTQEGPILEIGSGAGFLREFVPHLITSDVMAVPGVDMVLDAHNLPFADDGLKAITMVNVLHHLADPRRFLAEAGRCIAPHGALVMVEPWVTTWSKLIYTHLHHEPFDPRAKEWVVASQGPLSGANGALPWIIFHRDREQFEREFPYWQIETIRISMPFRYLISGGMSYRSLMPGRTLAFWRWLERRMAPFMNRWGMFALICLRRQARMRGTPSMRG